MPKPGKNESESDFMSRCVPIVLDDGTAGSQDQAVAICGSLWRDKSMPTPTSTNRAWSTFMIKTVSETDKLRIIEGIASTPKTDRVGDIVEPLGARFDLPMPFLWQHDSKQPIGHVVEAKANADGITFKAQLIKVSEPGRLKDRTDEAWQSMDLGLVRGLSIGFRGVDVEPIDKKDPWGGMRFNEWNWFELSAVTIPANIDATITNIRSIDQGSAALGKSAAIVAAAALGRPAKPAGASASRSIKIERGSTMPKMTNSERIKDLEAQRAAEVGAREAIQEKVAEENRTKDGAELTAFDEHSATIKALDRELADCRLLEKELIATARAVQPNATGDGVDVGDARTIRVSPPKLEKGIGAIKMLACKMHAQMFNRDVVAVARQFCGNWPEVEMNLKAAVAAGTTTGTTWASPLVYPANLTAEFFEYLVAQTFLNRIAGMTRVPFNSRVPRENSVISAQWVGEGKPKPVAAGSFDYVSLSFAKTACIMGVTDELARFSNPSVELLVRNNLSKGIAKFIDTQFIDPSVAAVANVSPAAVTSGADHDAASGTDIAAVVHDIREILFHFQENNIPTDNLVLIMQPVLATAIGTMMTTLGVMQFPNVNANGGNILGIQVLTSNNAPSGQITAIHAPSILIADDGQIAIDVSREASVELADNPTSTDYHLISAFQQNLVFVRAEQYVTWTRGRDKGVYYLTGAAYAGTVTG